jgi:hypothetical protein
MAEITSLRPIPQAPPARPTLTPHEWPQLGLRRAALLALLLALVGAFLLSLTLGSVEIPL